MKTQDLWPELRSRQRGEWRRIAHALKQAIASVEKLDRDDLWTCLPEYGKVNIPALLVLLRTAQRIVRRSDRLTRQHGLDLSVDLLTDTATYIRQHSR